RAARGQLRGRHLEGWFSIDQPDQDRSRPFRGTASFGPFFNVAPGETICFDMAFVFARDTTQDNIQNTRVLQQKVIALKQWYAQQAYGCGEYPDVGIQAPVEDGAALTLYPNPAQGQVTAARTDIREAWHVSVRSVTGELVHQALWPAGTRTWGFTTDALAEGVYMVRFSGDPGQVVRRLVVAR
ncbi:MAG TPA: T9SS type A sorting domain-containing protein, partial [Flavobacteriales bacterium]|nr:T9SS type A sorting domain-containing protein [Flavobacteriales bacterium]